DFHVTGVQTCALPIYLAELRQVLGMTPELYALAAPQLTVHGQAGTYSIRSEARLRGGRASRLIVVLRGGAVGTTGAAYTPLRWEIGRASCRGRGGDTE